MPTKSKVAFAVPNSLKNELRERVIKDGYGLRGKSKWISEAIEQLLEFKDFLKLIGYSDEMHGFDEMETVVIEYPLKIKLDKAILQIRRKFLTLEGVKSRVMRTAVLQRILRT